jgi:hypothetical protein
MVFKTTSTKKRRWGMTLVELMVASAAGSVLLLAIASLTFYTGRSFAALANYIDLDNYSRTALDKMSQLIRQTNKLNSFTSTSLVFEDFDGGTLTFQYDPQAKTLTKVKSGQPDDVLLRECNYLQFLVFQRNSVTGTYNQYSTASAATCKLVQLKWVCQRDVFGSRFNTESVQSAKIVIRKQ